MSSKRTSVFDVVLHISKRDRTDKYLFHFTKRAEAEAFVRHAGSVESVARIDFVGHGYAVYRSASDAIADLTLFQ